jgi:hypothetical protein
VNDSGVLGMPLRIMISLMVIALMVPALAAVADDMEMAADEAEGESLAGQVADAAARAYLSGAGSSVSLSMDIPFGRSLAIGGDGADAFTIRILSDGEQSGRLVMDNPPIRLICPETVLEGDAELLFEAVPHDGRLCVAVTVS